MTKVEFAAMSGSELVNTYNAMLELPCAKEALEPPRNKPVARFADHATAVKRCEALASTIRALQGATLSENMKKRGAVAEKTRMKIAKMATESRPLNNRKKVWQLLNDLHSQQVSWQSLSRSVYGQESKAIFMVLKGTEKDLQGSKEWVLRKEGKGENATYGIYKKEG